MYAEMEWWTKIRQQVKVERVSKRQVLRLLERKPGALDHARSLAGWDLPECFGVLRRRLENQDDGAGANTWDA